MNIHNNHDIGDDFAQYLKQALNIAQGKPFYKSNYIFNKYNTYYAPPHYPPGFSLMLAPVVKIWGMSFRAMFYFNSCLVVGLLFTCFAYFRKYMSMIPAICISIFIAYNQYMLNLKQNVLSDLPCLLFVMLYFLFRKSEKFTAKRIIMLILFAGMAILVRSQAILLLMAEGIWLILVWIKHCIRNRKFTLKPIFTAPSLYIITGTIAVLIFLYKVVFYSPASSFAYSMHYIDFTSGQSFFEKVAKQAGFLLSDYSDFFCFSVDNNFFKACMTFTGSAALVFTIIGFLITISKRLAIEDIFFLLMNLLVIYLTLHDLRYFLNALPLLFYYIFIAIRHNINAITHYDRRVIAIVITIIYMGLDFDNLKNTTKNTGKDLFPQQNDAIAMNYISTHVSSSDIIVFTKPRLLTLFTNKKCMNVAWELPMEMNKKIFDSLNVKYVLIMDKLGDWYLRDYINKMQHPIDSNRISEGCTLYLLR